MAKSPRRAIPPLPLSEAFYATLARVGLRFGLDVHARGALSAAVAALSRLYNRERHQLARGELGADAPLARLGFFLPRDLAKWFGPLSELERAGQLPRADVLRVLDLGAGLGSASLGLARFLRHAGHPTSELRVHAVEREQSALELMSALCEALAPLSDELVPVRLEQNSRDVHKLEGEGPYDLVLLGLVLNELFLELSGHERAERRAQFLGQLAERLAPGGAIIIVEPSLRTSARELMQVRERLCQRHAKLSIVAPCVHHAACPMLPRERDWCHEALDFALPPHLVPIAQAAGLRFEGLHYAALVLRKAPRVDASEPLLRIVSDPLPSKGKLELFGCGHAGLQRLVRLERERSSHNALFDSLRRGDVIALPEAARITREHTLRRR